MRFTVVFAVFIIFCLSASAADRVYLTHIPASVPENEISHLKDVEVKNNTVIFLKSGTQVLDTDGSKTVIHIIPGWLSLVPPLIAIVFAILFRQVILSLFLGIFVGIFIKNGFSFFPSLLESLSNIIPQAIATKDHVSIIIFSLLLGGMVGIISANGGTYAFVYSLRKKIISRKRAMLSCFALGTAIFFDDYANTLIAGNTMRPLFDKFKISREKLAYIVDSTAAPVASIAIISTWIGFEVGILSDIFSKHQFAADGYTSFVKSIPYLYYPVFTLFFVLILSLTGRDFGAMRRFEQAAAKAGVPDDVYQKSEESEISSQSYNSRPYHAWVPVLTVVVVTFGGLIITGYSGNFNIREIFSSADSFAALIWSSAAGCFIAGLLSIISRLLNVQETIDAWMEGIKSMMVAVVILCLAWSISEVCNVVHTADYIVSLFSTDFPFFLVPVITFIISAFMSFATGTSWGTMAITYPLLIPVVLGSEYMLPTIASVLAGAVFGDHCSPISDTTIMSSMASSCEHIAHVKTQMPYALTVGIISCTALLFPTVNPVWIYLLGLIVIFLIIRFAGKPLENK